MTILSTACCLFYCPSALVDHFLHIARKGRVLCGLRLRCSGGWLSGRIAAQLDDAYMELVRSLGFSE